MVTATTLAEQLQLAEDRTSDGYVCLQGWHENNPWSWTYQVVMVTTSYAKAEKWLNGARPPARVVSVRDSKGVLIMAR